MDIIANYRLTIPGQAHRMLSWDPDHRSKAAMIIGVSDQEGTFRAGTVSMNALDIPFKTTYTSSMDIILRKKSREKRQLYLLAVTSLQLKVPKRLRQRRVCSLLRALRLQEFSQLERKGRSNSLLFLKMKYR